MQTKLIQEARKNLHLNPKTSINRIISDRLATTQDTIAGVPNLFVSFTAIDKLGVNPRSGFSDTPLGIYCYPAEYIVREIGQYASPKKLPFAGDQPFVNVFSIKGNIIDLSNIIDSEFNMYAQRIAKVFEQVNSTTSQLDHWIQSSTTKAQPPSLGGRLFFIIARAAQLLSEIPKYNSPKRIVAWAKLFRLIGIDGCVDTGKGIIHQAEPTQAVIFRTSSIVNNKRYYNKYSPNEIEPKKSGGGVTAKEKHIIGQAINHILKEPDAHTQLIEFLTNRNVPFKLVKLSSIPDAVIDQLIKNNPELFWSQKYLPTHIQKQLIKSNINNIKHIQHPDLSIQLQAVQASPINIQYITNPHLQTKHAAIARDPYNIRHMSNPDPVIQLAAVRANPNVIRLIKTPTLDAQAVAIQQDPELIKSINTPNEFLKTIAVKADPASILYVPNPSRTLKLAAFVLINRLSELNQLTAIANNPDIIQYITNPSEAVQLAVIRKSSQHYKYIKNPAPAAKELFMNLTK